jgi:glycerol-3-phosphate O-acyltransferase
MRPEDRERIQIEVTQRVVDRVAQQAKNAPEGFLQTVVNDTIYHELRRLEGENPRKPLTKEQRSHYLGVRRKLVDAADANQRALLDDLARRFVAEVVGNFDQRVYRLSTTLIPTGLSVLLNAMSPGRLLKLDRFRRGLADHLTIQGESELVRGLLDKGTLVVVPTHSSNLDSILLGYAVYLLGLPPLLYGAGLNLFSNPLMSFFMRNLGAYRVDRKKTAPLYRDVLKEYATVAAEYGYHQLFFPGGTRSRSGMIETHLKRGLMGTAVRAYVSNLQNRRARPNLYIVPCTLSYKLVLEAETLIGDYLAETGKARFIIEDDEFSKPRRLLNFMTNALSLEDEIVLTFSKPMDVFGNFVDADGRSLDPQGRVVDTRTYVTRDGVPFVDEQRDMQYTNETAERVVERYLVDNVLMSTNLVARAIFNLLRQANPGLDFFRLLHTGGETASFTMAEVHNETADLLEAISELPLKPRLSTMLAEGDIQTIVSDALTHFGIYHTHSAAARRGDRVFHEDRNLLLFYANRLEGYGLPALSRRLAA